MFERIKERRRARASAEGRERCPFDGACSHFHYYSGFEAYVAYWTEHQKMRHPYWVAESGVKVDEWGIEIA